MDIVELVLECGIDIEITVSKTKGYIFCEKGSKRYG